MEPIRFTTHSPVSLIPAVLVMPAPGARQRFTITMTVNIAFTGYNAKTGTAAYATADQTCSNVSCHGGKKTPAWGTGSINVATECTACHASSGQYNSYTSGEHRKHVQDLKELPAANVMMQINWRRFTLTTALLQP